MRYGRTDFFPWGCYSGKLSAPSDSPSHKRKSWSTQESLRSVDAVENWLAHLQQVLSFPSFTQSSGQALGAPLATRRAEKPPVPAAGTRITLHHRSVLEGWLQLGVSRPEQAFYCENFRDLMVIPSFCMICSSKTQQWSSLLLSTSGYVLGWRLSTLSSLNQIEDFPIRGRKGGE